MESFIDPKVLARIKDLPFIAKTLAQGFLQGIHPSQMRGTGMEFNQYRSYEPGDELAKIDWKLFARSDRYFVREAERESETSIYIIIDCSKSMQMRSLFSGQQSNKLHSPKEPLCWNKFNYAQHLAATLAYIALNQGDNVGLIQLCGKNMQILPAANNKHQWFAFTEQLSQSTTQSHFQNATEFTDKLAPLTSQSTVIFLSDFYQTEDEIVDFLTPLAATASELEAWQLYCTDEIAFPYDKTLTFVDLETNETVLIDSKLAKSQYKKVLEDHNTTIEQQLNDANIQVNKINIDEPLDNTLHYYLQRRLRGMS